MPASCWRPSWPPPTGSGLGSCPISAIRNHAQQVSDILSLPDHVFPVAALGVGWPSFEGVMSPRLGLDVTIHRDRYDEGGLREKVAAYDKRREAVQPYRTQRYTDKFGQSADVRLVGGQGAAIFGA